MEVDGRYVITEPGVPKDKEVPTEKPLIPLRQPKVLVSTPQDTPYT